MGRGAAAAGGLGALLAKLDELEQARAGDRLAVGAGVDQRALPGEDALAGARRDDRAGDAFGAVDRDRRGIGVDRRRDVERGAERPVRALVVGRRDRVDVDEAEAREAGDDAGRDPLAGGVDDLRRPEPRRPARPRPPGRRG
jgi:hypothetical protein